MNPVAAWAVARLREPSTYGGIAAFVATLTFLPSADLTIAVKTVTLLATVVPAVLAMVLAESKA